MTTNSVDLICFALFSESSSTVAEVSGSTEPLSSSSISVTEATSTSGEMKVSVDSTSEGTNAAMQILITLYKFLFRNKY